MTLSDSPIRRKPVAPPSPTGADNKEEPTWDANYNEKPIVLNRKGKGKEKATVSAFDRLPREIIQEYVLARALAQSCLKVPD